MEPTEEEFFQQLELMIVGFVDDCEVQDKPAFLEKLAAEGYAVANLMDTLRALAVQADGSRAFRERVASVLVEWSDRVSAIASES